MNLSRSLADITVFCYSGLLTFASTVLFPLLRGIGRERGWDLDRRQKLPSPVRDFRGKQVVWLHAASLGEAKLLVKFSAMLRERNAEEFFLVTAATRNGVAYLEKQRKCPFCAIGFLPIDTIPLVTQVVTHFNISRLWLMETEIWPSLLYVCRRRGIPVGIVNGRIEAASFARYRRIRWFIAPLLGQADIVLAQTDEYAARFAALGVAPEALHVVGNIKGHIRISRPQKEEWLAVRRALNIDEETFVVTAGCIHAGEGTVLRAFAARMEQLGYPCKLIVVPRYREETQTLLDEIGGNVVHLVEPATQRRWNICCIEKTGILDDLYKAADAAIIGGTFIDIGGHNVWEAAAYSIPLFFGPYVHQQKESCAQLLEAGVAFSATDGEELARRMHEVLREEPLRFIEAQRRFVEATNKTGSIVEPLLP